MTRDIAVLSIGSYTTINGRRLNIIRVDSFGGTLHFGIISVDDGAPITGWIPVSLVGQCEW